MALSAKAFALVNGVNVEQGAVPAGIWQAVSQSDVYVSHMGRMVISLCVRSGMQFPAPVLSLLHAA